MENFKRCKFSKNVLTILKNDAILMMINVLEHNKSNQFAVHNKNKEADYFAGKKKKVIE
jgi:hypothetical protein